MSAELFRQIEETIAKCDGWCPLDKANALAAMVLALRPKTVIEIGVFGGRSLLPMALALKQIGDGVVIGIDPWSAQASTAEMTEPKNVEYWANLDHDRIYKRFCDNVNLCGVGKHTVTVRQKSDDYTPPDGIDMVHVDGNHEEAAYRDITRFGAKVRIGGILVADDLGWCSGAPKRGADWLLQNGFAELYPLGTGAVFQRIR